MTLKPPSPTELRSGPRTWANIGALFLLVGGLLLVVGDGLALRVLGLFTLAQGAKALWAGVELQFEGNPTRKPLLGVLLLNVIVFVTLGVARLMGTWH
jgi:hypothetical protein